MKFSLIQFEIRWLNPHANMETVTQLIDLGPDADIYVLPVMWATGFNTSPNYYCPLKP